MLTFGDERTGVAPSPVELSFKLGHDATDEIQKVSAETGVSTDALLQIALRLLFIAADARSKDQRLLVTSRSGFPIKELVIAGGQR
jgi:hypothetical protein